MQVWLFLIIATVAVTFAICMVLLRNAVHGALCLVVTLAALAVFYLLLKAEFIAVVQVAVYAGAIMVLFLFVMMLLNIQGSEDEMGERPKMQVFSAVLLGVLLLGEVAYMAGRYATLVVQEPSALPSGFGTPFEIGLVMFERYLLPFEIASVILLAAMAGALVLAKRRLA